MAQYVLGERAAEAVRQLMAGDSSVGRVKATVPTPVDPVEFPAPWYIEYSASEDDGNGSWVIWLPEESFKSEKSAYESAFTTMRGSMTACTSRPAGWYRISRNLSSGGVMYLTIDTSSSSSTPTMAIEDDVSEDVMIPLAYLNRDTTTGEVTVKQYQVGVMTYGGGGAVETVPRHFDIEDDKVVNCKIYCGNQFMSCNDYTITGSGDIWLHVTRSSSAYTISVDQTFVAETSSSISIKLWEYSVDATTGEVTKLDVRPGFIPVFAI